MSEEKHMIKNYYKKIKYLFHFLGRTLLIKVYAN